ncbi:MAG: hypothetical protein IJT59_03960 [Desulfovibrionaceae bacterium]|nr:hypothetical protein [Desulfovibrionaceae bacterium]
MEPTEKYDVIDRECKLSYHIGLDDDERARAEAIEKARLDALSMIRYKEEEIRNEVRISVAKNMLKENSSVDLIKKVTTLSEEQIRSLM